MKIRNIVVNIILPSIFVLAFFAFAGGIINASIEGQNFNIADFIPSRAVQNNFETIIGIFVLIFGFIGVVIMYKAYDAIKNNEKYIYLGIGFIIFSISVTLMYKIIELKM
ncbi:MAG: hypothetical protein H0X03_03110 [Nitrosopumilus sp.]|nr:hypothetical protein [Nitrosopumilus sp.]